MLWTGSPRFSITRIESSDIYRIVVDIPLVNDSWWGFLTNSDGEFWYSDAEPDTPTDTIPDITAKEESHENGVIWVSSDTANGLSLSGYVTLLTQDQLSPYRTWGRQSRGNMVEYRAINNFTAVSDLATNSYLAYRFYNGDGTYKDSLLVTPSKLSNYYTGTEQTVSDNTGNGDTNLTIGDVLLLDALNKFIVSPEGDINFIDNVTFDQSSKTYNFTTNNEYNYYDNRSWSYSWTYHINYTSITYIGQSEEYDKSYEFYYELPDGRSSADLTAEELEQLNLAVDVINYGRSADDTRLRSLYHFDGNTDDASYWNYCTAFTWNQGASLTYLESGNFNGALYLDETDHDFTLTLPSALGSNDFTLQFRYYQSATAAPQNDSYIRFGSTDLMRFNGSQILNGSGTVLSSMPIGTWNELAIIRESGTVRYYLNGVQLGTVSNSTAFTAAVTFHFGSSQQTYKELDELRVLNYALTEGGASYTPTSVPHDTNLALVLPDSVVPIADEYWDIHNDSQTNLLSQYNLDWWDVVHFDTLSGSSYFYKPYIMDPKKTSSITINGVKNTYTYKYYRSFNRYPYFYIFEQPVVGVGSKFGGSSSIVYYYGEYTQSANKNYGFLIPCSGVSSILSYRYNNSTYSNLTPGEYTFSIVSTDGSIGNFTFTLDSINSHFGTNSILNSKSVLGYNFSISKTYSMSYDGEDYYYESTLCLNIVGTDTAKEIIYMELVEGDHTDLSAEFVSSVTLMDSASLNSPTLAVRSDIPVTNYQIGGVRPSIPYKGLVWAMVESGYISSLQIYDGRAWVQCDGRIWTGERWIPYSSYNVVTLSDMYDIADASGQSGYEYIYSESGFWSWFQKAWLDFRQWTSTMLSTVQGLGSGGGSGGQAPITMDDLDEVNGSDWDLVEDSSLEDGSFIGAIRTAGSGTWYLLRLTFGHMLSIFNNVGNSGEVLSAPFDNDSPDYAFGYFTGGG